MQCQTKNVIGLHRAVRIGIGAVMVVAGWLLLPDQVAGYPLAAVGAMALTTGLVGFCPACRLMSRNRS
jgi:hypothetical protein